MLDLVVQIENVNGINMVSSRVIAQQLGKEHSDVTRKIKDTLKIRGIGNVSDTYEAIEILKTNEQNKKSYSEYLVTKDGFILLMMNYVGYNDFKRAYIKRFNELEEAVKNPINALLSMTKEQLVGNVLELAQIVKDKEEIIEVQKPKVDYHDKVLQVDKLLTITQVAKDLGKSAKSLNKELHEIGLIFKESKNWNLYSNYQHLVPKYFDYHITEYGQTLKATENGRKLIINIIEQNNIKKALSIIEEMENNNIKTYVAM